MENNYFQELADLPMRELMPGFKGKFVHMENITMAYWEIAKGSVLPEHSHVHEQTTNVVSGELEMTIGGKTQVLTNGQVGIMPGNVPHSGRAITDCVVIDVFSPAREDYKAPE